MHFARYHFLQSFTSRGTKGHPKPFVTGSRYDRWIPFEYEQHLIAV